MKRNKNHDASLTFGSCGIGFQFGLGYTMATSRQDELQTTEAGPSGQAVSRPETVAALTEQRQPPQWKPIRRLNDKEEKLPRSRRLRFIIILRVVFLLVSVGLLIVSTVAWLKGILIEVRPIWNAYADGVLKSLITASIAVAADCLYLSLFHGTNLGWQTAILGFASDIGAIVVGALAIVVYAGDINQFLYSSSDDTNQVNLAVLEFTVSVMYVYVASLLSVDYDKTVLMFNKHLTINTNGCRRMGRHCVDKKDGQAPRLLKRKGCEKVAAEASSRRTSATQPPTPRQPA
ncbi:hypothetical protein VHEMI03160 [[Torrubiella] hemipterigena]|uniref:Uncharacterized protein n=1 Tax=[Torrubiella] hemipterigena TaxID=1531966 RepID=A0A0A1TA47_9HYPO|nr:hypothetical protein VHEMI03160 [[Torrubiella] hemipterigena]